MITGRDLLTLLDLSSEELKHLIELSMRFKAGNVKSSEYSDLKGKKALLLFEKPSTRTRLSLETACLELGMFPIYVYAGTTQLARGEPIEDFARVVERYVDLVAARVYSHRSLELLAEHARVPIINALSDLYHPLQAIADFATIKEKTGKLKGNVLCFVGDVDNNVAHSLTIGAAMLGMEIRLLGPRAFWPKREFLDRVRSIAEAHGGRIIVTDKPEEGVRDANIIYTDVWVSMGQEEERERRLKMFRPYQVYEELLKAASPEYIFMHCLPRHRGEEVSDDVFESQHSVVFDQAEYRLHSAKAVLVAILHGCQ